MSPGLPDLEVAKAVVAANPELLPDSEHEPKDLTVSGDSVSVSSSVKDSKEKEISRGSTTSPSVFSRKSYDSPKLLKLPPQKGHPLYRAFRWQFFSVYRKIYTVVFLLNLLWGVVGFSFGDFGSDDYASGKLASDSVATAVAVNVMVSIAVRNEHVINVLFATSIAVPHSFPLWFRRSCAMIYSYGGFHSGCATASAVWYAVYTGIVIREYTSGRQPSPVFVVFASILLALLISIIVLALPNVRQKYHDYFEGVHRFAGWAVLALFWAQLATSAVLRARTTSTPTPAGIILLTSPAFWFLLTATLLVIYPWARLRLCPVTAEPLSAHAIRLHFFTHRPALCSAIRVSDRPLIENHAFATIPRSDGREGFSLVVSAAGDWTRRVIAAPPRALWVRSGPAQGMAAVAKLFSPVVMVATGSGIGPCLGFFVGAPEHDVRIIWSTRNPERTYGAGVVAAVRKADPRACIVDTDRVGRQDLPALAYSVYKESGAEGVVIISNKRVVDWVVFELESRGVPAYGPVFDS
ncbi:gramicidin s synthetase 1 [Macrophomina phaseolina]|uniref:Gramicidin s synthetase 1 n=1 Tax=Macrophomina phaseolina TaxID=35725 RepID=A0ABQ8GFK5_9PEZI|nr:gramicidin s synthetase 1 [Macrophomina phaseolina]